MANHLFITADSGLSDAALKARLLALVAAEGREYGIVVRRMAGASADPQAEALAMVRGAEGGARVAPDAHREGLR